MKHPTREEWMSYLHDEADRAERQVLQEHLNHCEECRTQIAVWQEARRRLDVWKIARLPARRTSWFAWPRWAAAAAAVVVVLAVGVALGRFTDPAQAQIASLRTEVETLKSSIDDRAAAAARVETWKQLGQFATGLNARMAALEDQHASDYASLRHELETVAVFTQAGFNQTENRFVQLADYTVAGSSQKPQQ